MTRSLVLGIDTGGTYTDGVLMDYETREVLATHKSLTTRRDYSIGIESVIEQIEVEDPTQIRMVSISTTLATNAIAEGKGKRVGLLLIGYDPELIAAYHLERRFATPSYAYFKGGHDLYGREKQALDLDSILEHTIRIKSKIDALAVSSYFSPLNPEHELRAFEALSRICDLPIVLGHQLSTRLGSVERATTAALNASLLAVLQEFVIAVRQAMERRRIEAPLMVVRGDGTLMSDEFAARTPVETIHSGPAASAIGGRLLSNLDDALVVDIGGTTTDIALLRGGQVTVSEDGASVGEYKTSVRAADLLSIGLGGDSHLRVDRDGELHIGPQRVTPLAYLAEKHTSVAKRLKALTRRTWEGSSPDWLEYWYLVRDPDQVELEGGDGHRALLEVLRAGPLPLPELAQKLGVTHTVQLGAETLHRREILGRAGLTPTDLLHAEGRFLRWNREAAEDALTVQCKYLFEEADVFRERVWRKMTEKIISAILNFLTPHTLEGGEQTEAGFGRWFFQNSLYATHQELETKIRLRIPMIGIGAPADILLPQAAELLNTELVLPAHFQVANAVGAVGGSVMVEEQVLVYPEFAGTSLDVVGYIVQTSRAREMIEQLPHALERAQAEAAELALGAALRSGADSPEVIVTVEEDGIDTYRVRARALGNPRLMK